jgi:hypothetical protein
LGTQKCFIPLDEVLLFFFFVRGAGQSDGKQAITTSLAVLLGAEILGGDLSLGALFFFLFFPGIEFLLVEDGVAPLAAET